MDMWNLVYEFKTTDWFTDGIWEVRSKPGRDRNASTIIVENPSSWDTHEELPQRKAGHKWRIGHESVATCQTKEFSIFALNLLFFQLNQFVSLFASNDGCNWVVKIYMFWKNLFSVS
jgi:hypothetical protein